MRKEHVIYANMRNWPVLIVCWNNAKCNLYGKVRETVKKRLLALGMIFVMVLAASGCESDAKRLARLEREAREARQRANEAQQKVDFLEALFGD